MVMILDIYDMPMRCFSNMLEHVGGHHTDLDRYLQEQYLAVPIKGTWDQWQYMFPDQDKYAEFILTWL